jgi:hypothetical protein
MLTISEEPTGHAHGAFNLGELAGLHGLASLIPLLAVWGLAAVLWGLDKSSRAVRAAPNPALGAELSPHKPESIPPKNEVFIDWLVVFQCGSVWSFGAELLGRVCDRPFSLTPIFSVH